MESWTYDDNDVLHFAQRSITPLKDMNNVNCEKTVATFLSRLQSIPTTWDLLKYILKQEIIVSTPRLERNIIPVNLFGKYMHYKKTRQFIQQVEVFSTQVWMIIAPVVVGIIDVYKDKRS